MRIVVNDIAASSGGALSILKSFYNFVLSSDVGRNHEWIFLLSDYYIEEAHNIKIMIFDEVKKSWLQRLKFDLLSGRSVVSELNPDVVFSLQNTITFGLECPQVLYMHQSIPFQKEKKFSFFKSEERMLAVYQFIIGRIIKKSIEKSDLTVVQTKWMKNAVLKTVNIASEKIIEVFPSYERHREDKKKSLYKNNSFFYPASNIIYKNHKCIYDARDILYKKGITDFNISLTIDEQSNNNNKNITCLGSIPYEEVLERYNSSILLFPSYIETIGLPLVEARSTGTIIFAADCLYSREVLSGYENAFFFNPFRPNELADLMKKAIFGEIVMKESLAEEKEIKALNSWEYIVNKLLTLGKRGISERKHEINEN